MRPPGSSLPQDPGRQPRRDRGADHPRLPRDGHRAGRRLLRGRPRRPARAAWPTRPTCIGPAPSRESYLRIDRVLEVARAQRARTPSIPATASWPRTPTSRAPARTPGSSSSARAARRSRSWARRPRRAAWPWRRACPSCPARCEPLRRRRRDRAARPTRIGFPVMLKAAAGGGGKGMRLVADAGGARAAPRRARARGAERLRRRRVYLEKAVAAAAPHRDPGPGRRARQRRAPLRARVLDPAPPPEGDRGEPVARRHRRSCASAWARSRWPSCRRPAT